MRNMKACILTIVDLSRLSMTMAYTDYFIKHGIDYDVIFYDKFHEYDNNHDNHLVPMHLSPTEESSSIKKIIAFWKKRSDIRKRIEEGHYDIIVVWNEVTSFIFGGMLRKHFPFKYTVNIRDYFYLDNPIVHSRLKKTINQSILSTVSSYGYLNYLPDHEYIFLHSLNKSLLKNLDRPYTKAINRPIRIEYIGQIAWLDSTYHFVDILGNDERFELLFYGIGSDKIESYASEKGYKNIKTRGKFPTEKTAEYLKEADIIYNLYGYGNKHLDLALSIKLYYAIYLGVPILTYSGTCTNDVACKCGIGYTVHGIDSMEKDLLGLFDWYQEYNLQEAQEKCKEFIEREIDFSESKFYKKLDQYMEEI